MSIYVPEQSKDSVVAVMPKQGRRDDEEEMNIFLLLNSTDCKEWPLARSWTDPPGLPGPPVCPAPV